MVAALPGVLNFGNGNKRLQLQLDKLFQLGYYDERQNFEALEKSRGDVKKAVAFISDGTVPDSRLPKRFLREAPCTRAHSHMQAWRA